MSEKKVKIIRMTVLVLLGITFIVPFLIMVVGAFIDAKIPVGNPFTWIVTHDLTFKNFEHIFKYSPILTWLWNSIVISVIPTVFQMFFATDLGLYLCP
ncbi:hypothetical protein MGH68_16680 [Erysipelothrix sp. D19-032]